MLAQIKKIRVRVEVEIHTVNGDLGIYQDHVIFILQSKQMIIGCYYQWNRVCQQCFVWLLSHIQDHLKERERLLCKWIWLKSSQSRSEYTLCYQC